MMLQPESIGGPTNTLSPDLPGTSLEWHAVTHPGLVRENNEDAYCVEVTERAGNPSYLLCVADGLGGHQGGEVASQLAALTVRREFLAWDGASPDKVATNMVRQANLRIYNAAQADHERFNMQTTLLAGIISGDRLTVAHVGDCRLYRLRGGRADVLTKDHTLAMEMGRMRMISVEQAADHPGRYQLTRSVGGNLLVQVDTIRERVAPGDLYLFCSDGLWSEVTHEEIVAAVRNPSLEAATAELVELALSRGGPDNLTGVICRVTQVTAAAPSPPRWRSLLGWANGTANGS